MRDHEALRLRAWMRRIQSFNLPFFPLGYLINGCPDYVLIVILLDGMTQCRRGRWIDVLYRGLHTLF